MLSSSHHPFLGVGKPTFGSETKATTMIQDEVCVVLNRFLAACITLMVPHDGTKVLKVLPPLGS